MNKKFFNSLLNKYNIINIRKSFLFFIKLTFKKQKSFYFLNIIDIYYIILLPNFNVKLLNIYNWILISEWWGVLTILSAPSFNS